MAMILGIIAISCYGQKADLEIFESLVENDNYLEAIEKSKSIETSELDSTDLANYFYLLSKAYRSNNDQSSEMFYLMKSRDVYKNLQIPDSLDQVNFSIISVLINNSDSLDEISLYVKEYLEEAEKNQDHKKLGKIYHRLGIELNADYPFESLKYFRKALAEIQQTDEEFIEGRIYQGLGATFAKDTIMKLDSALVMIDKAMKIYKKQDEKSFQALLFINRGVIFTKKGDYQKALEAFHSADTSKLDKFKRLVKPYIYGHRGNMFKAKGDYKSALEEYEKKQIFMDSLHLEDQKRAIKDIETKYKTAEKELENQKLVSEVKIKNYSLVSAGILLVLLLVTGVLLYTFITKKRKIAEQEKAIQVQKMQTMLREQELHEIDVMLESQEKERQRIANDLHDNLGSLLSALKLNFNTLGKREIHDENSRRLFEKTEELINETYVQVRNISHLKNLGVVGKEGLLTAVKKMAEKMSVINELQFNVIPFGLSNRLESNLEITLFRMIQELCSNIIKHSGANEVNIYLTQHDTHQLNVIIEDNGKGFDPKVMNKENSGIGLKNIEKKVEQLGGTFTIDSSENKGTTIIIDIPL
ncbi:tetratricopeptide repeat-containing sensor histidine kinase [Neptunitalea lumnitzerae]|nr:sensor histidine kinase [Neptunitalea sp. Y10]